METGEINVFDPAKILSGESADGARIFANSKHTGPVRGLDFNPIQKNLLLSGGVNAEVRTPLRGVLIIALHIRPQQPYQPHPSRISLHQTWRDHLVAVEPNCFSHLRGFIIVRFHIRVGSKNTEGDRQLAVRWRSCQGNGCHWRRCWTSNGQAQRNERCRLASRECE